MSVQTGPKSKGKKVASVRHAWLQHAEPKTYKICCYLYGVRHLGPVESTPHWVLPSLTLLPNESGFHVTADWCNAKQYSLLLPLHSVSLCCFKPFTSLWEFTLTQHQFKQLSWADVQYIYRHILWICLWRSMKFMYEFNPSTPLFILCPLPNGKQKQITFVVSNVECQSQNKKIKVNFEILFFVFFCVVFQGMRNDFVPVMKWSACYWKL